MEMSSITFKNIFRNILDSLPTIDRNQDFLTLYVPHLINVINTI